MESMVSSLLPNRQTCELNQIAIVMSKFDASINGEVLATR